MQAKHLSVGESFIVPSCTDSMRNCVCLRISPTATYATFEERKGINEPWKRVYEYVGNETNVEVDSTKPIVKVVKNKRGELDVYSDREETAPDSTEGARAIITHGKISRGRKKKELNWPTDTFIIPSLAKELNVSPTTIYVKLMVMIKEGKAKVVGESRKEGSRGKSTKIYSLIN